MKYKVEIKGKDAIVTFDVKDDLSGLEHIEYNGVTTTDQLTFFNNGIYYVNVTDNAGNVSVVPVEVNGLPESDEISNSTNKGEGSKNNTNSSPKTGEKSLLVYFGASFAAICTMIAIKLREIKEKNTKK